MKTPNVPHLFGEQVQDFLLKTRGWLISGISSSVPWPQEDVLVEYDGYRYVLLGASGGEPLRRPGLLVPSQKEELDDALGRAYRFVSVLGWFKGGFVDITGHAWSTAPIRYGVLDTLHVTLDGSKNGFDCNHLPIVEDDQVRRALAFMREGRRLREVHEPYAFLSFFKVIESQFSGPQRKAWVAANLSKLKGRAAERVAALATLTDDVGYHLYESGRCAVAHASVGEVIVDPDISQDRRRIAQDLVVMEALASLFLAENAGVPTENSLLDTLDRTEPWHRLLPEETVARLRAKEEVPELADLGNLELQRVSVRLRTGDVPPEFLKMTVEADGYGPGVLFLNARNERKTILLRFEVDFGEGKVWPILKIGAFEERSPEMTEDEVAQVARYNACVLGNCQVELLVEGADPVACEIVVPVNVHVPSPEDAIAAALEEFRRFKAGVSYGFRPPS